MAVEFDTAKNAFDPNENHIAVLRDGRADDHLAIATTLPVPVERGQTLYFWVDYDGPTTRLDVFVAASPTKPATPVLTHAIDLLAVVGNQAHVGLTAGTGVQATAHEVLSWWVTHQP